MFKIPVKYLLIIGAVILILVGIVVFVLARKRWAKAPDGSTIPAGWTATAQTVTLHDSMAGPGTDETTIFAILASVNKAQLAEIYNKFQEMYSDSLVQWLQDDLTGEQLQRAMSYFEGIEGIEKLGGIRGGGGGVSRFLRSVAR